MFNFPKQVASLEDVPEIFRPLYTQSGSGFVLHPDAVESVDTSGLKSALDKERADRKAAVAENNEFKKIAESPEALATIMQDLNLQANKAAGIDQRTLDKARIEIETGYLAKEKGWQEKLTKMEASLTEHMIDSESEREINAHDGNSLFLKPHVRAQVKVMMEGDKYVARVLDKDGDPRINGRGEPMRIADLIGEMKSNESFAGAFKVPQKAGSGKQPGAMGAPPTSNPSTALSPREKILSGLEKRA